MPATNNSRNRYQQTIRKDKAQLFAYYDAQPAATRRMFQDFPENLWPASYNDHFSGFAEAHKRYLANLKNIWGADHPAVQDAAARVQIKRNRVVSTLTADDLSDLF
jgi:hypothetical protein